MRSRTIAALGLAGAALLAACGQAASGSSTAASPHTPAIARPASAVHVSSSPLGDILVNGDGRTLYGFTLDSNAMSACSGTCAHEWPPLEVNASWKTPVSSGVANLHTIMRNDGHLQLAAGKWPLYLFSGDHGPGDINGQGLSNFFVVGPNAKLLKNASSPTTTAAPANSFGY